MAQSTMLRTLYERVARIVFAGQYPLKQIASGGTVGTWLMASDAYPKTSISAYGGVFIHIISDAGGAGAAPENEIRTVTATGFIVASGTFTITPNFTVAPASGDIALFYYGLHRDDILEAINDVVRTCNLPRYDLLSLVADGNMNGANATVATDWPDATGTPTQTKETVIVLTGKQSLKIVTTTLDHSVRSLSVPVTEGEQLHLVSAIKVTAGSLRVQLYDVTNAAEIDGVTIDEEDWTEVRFTENVPNNCQNVQVRYIAKTATTTAYVDTCGLLSSYRRVYSIPNEIADVSDIQGIYSMGLGYVSEVNFSYQALQEALLSEPYQVLRDYAGVNSHRIIVEPARGTYPLYIKYRSAETTALSATTDTTYIPVEIITEGAAAGCFEKLAQGTRDQRRQSEYMMRALHHTRVYRGMLEGIGLGKPIAKWGKQKRVSVG